jgi:glycosyltransferase involved in cell wall biosynthesis
MPEIGYQETYLARAFSRSGHEVKIITSTAISPTGQKVLKQSYPSGTNKDEKYGYVVTRLPALINLNAKVISRGIQKAIDEFNPDKIIILALAKIFPAPLLHSKYGSKIIALFGDAAEYTDKTTFKKKVKALFNTLIQKRTKHALYNKVVKHSNKIILNIPESLEYFNNLLKAEQRPLFEKKAQLLSLGFDPDSFFFNESARQTLRLKHQIPNEACVIITSTRVNRQKKLEKIIDDIATLQEEGQPIHYIIIGFLNDAYEQELKQYIGTKKYSKCFHTLGFQDHETIRNYYAAADAGLWIKAAISIQESMGTGLRVILQHKPSVSHLLHHGKNGWYFEANSMLATIRTAVQQILATPISTRIEERKNIVNYNTSLYSYDVISNKILS